MVLFITREGGGAIGKTRIPWWFIKIIITEDGIFKVLLVLIKITVWEGVDYEQPEYKMTKT